MQQARKLSIKLDQSIRVQKMPTHPILRFELRSHLLLKNLPFLQVIPRRQDWSGSWRSRINLVASTLSVLPVLSATVAATVVAVLVALRCPLSLLVGGWRGSPVLTARFPQRVAPHSEIRNEFRYSGGSG